MKTDITTLWDLSREQMEELLTDACDMKERQKRGVSDQPLRGRTAGLLFDKPSTRTRVSFEAAMNQLGGLPMFINAKDTQINRDEPIADTARVLSRYLDVLVIRTFSQDLLTEFADNADIPIINALTDLYHPCQILSDLQTVIEEKGGIGNLENLDIAWVGDGNNVAHSWIEAAAILGLKLVLACPKGYHPSEKVLSRAVKEGHGRISVVEDPKEAVKNADVIYTDVWASMGQESESRARKKLFAGFTVDDDLVARAKEDVIVMHCLPAHRGEEITHEVMEGPRSVVWDQAENKLHMHKAVLNAVINKWR